ncbi:hypothetical protein [Sphingobium sp.]|uniref:hypothetical protein n=1 Tax=Sphingobium sp. TaxID=1912891 RepID=UPI003BB75F94
MIVVAAFAVELRTGCSLGWSMTMPMAPIANPPKKRRKSSDLKNATMALPFLFCLGFVAAALRAFALTPAEHRNRERALFDQSYAGTDETDADRNQFLSATGI